MMWRATWKKGERPSLNENHFRSEGKVKQKSRTVLLRAETIINLCHHLIQKSFHVTVLHALGWQWRPLFRIMYYVFYAVALSTILSCRTIYEKKLHSAFQVQQN